ncbi:PhzF family phenazine biosynthesis protein [Listeria monocytogenes]|uniref:PhzF family phenazine biosynthesis protein n=1 Tax=Listeria monocytogenes TaxID=1639 RepID=UPI0001B4288E|nr:PhzF family phenazine biosynthesis protein [Listeria monocytogenes]EAC5140738.1 PhzF family phenazine biosynthesis protein [Listeria monocytogenes]EAC7685423.1 PhzF family phenazine biosynthesis protein [Listeria monocytogenes]EAC7905274.1 PhzF family phenazine biosynthesis protein [Listeria monocytogenes]EAC8073944.1 PhzF family phenazine biosynthesis protein [Listeria monocytogenes]EAC9015776.1 PhzF family phenazine biosynthesis protein [Listeria monocytogenes]
MDISVYVASAFSKNNKGGNKAGVVLNEPTLTTTQKMAIAKQLGYAETAFLTESNHADFKLEYFTPKEEVDLCGHATIGTFTILMHLNKIHKSRYTIETNSGVLTITIKDGTIFMEQNQPTFYDIIPPNNLTDCFDLNLLNANYPIQIVSTGLKDILVPLKSEADLYTLEPNFEEVKKVSKHYEVVGMHLYTFSDDRIICRNFAPLFDINEEAATGTSNGALACYLYQNQYLQKELYVFEQGHSLHSPSEILVNLDVNVHSEIARVYVGGNGYYCETKYLSIE